MPHRLVPGELRHSCARQLLVFRLCDDHAGGSHQILTPLWAEDQLSELVRIYVLVKSRALPIHILINGSTGAFHVAHNFGLVNLGRVVGQLYKSLFSIFSKREKSGIME